MDPKVLRKLIDSSSFNRACYRVDTSLDYLASSLALYTAYHEREAGQLLSLSDLIVKATPEFQRANNKWTRAMKIKFVENVLKGCRSEVMLFRVGDRYSDAKIIDGLQRLTALADFLDNKFTIFGDATLDDVQKSLTNKTAMLGIRVYDFKDMQEAIKFYIDMNENITHSTKDINKAKDWAKANLGVDL